MASEFFEAAGQSSGFGGIEPSGARYRSAGVGMGQLLQMADEQRADTLTDRVTDLSRRQRGELVILVENDPPLFNPTR